MTINYFFENDDGRWFKEEVTPSIGHAIRADKVLFEDQSEHQHLVVMENEIFGRLLCLNGFIQASTADEWIYHEMVTHVPMLAFGEPKRVLVIGGGDGGVLREVFRHPSVEHATLVEIEKDVIDFCTEWMPELSNGSFDDPRLDVVITDGAKWVKEYSGEKFDVIIVDSTDPVGPGIVLFTEEFYRDCKSCLTDGGVLVTQSGLPFLQPEELKMGYRNMKPSFDHFGYYIIAVPAYSSGGHMVLGFACEDETVRNVCVDELQSRMAKLHGFEGFKYYTPEVHKAAFALPKFICTLMDEA